MLQGISGAAASQTARATSGGGPVSAMAATIASQDTFELSGEGTTLIQQTHEPEPKLIPLLNHLMHVKPDLSVKSDLHINESLYG